MLPGGCDTGSPAAPPATDIQFDPAQADQVAQAMLKAMRAEVAAIAKGDRAASAAYRSFLTQTLPRSTLFRRAQERGSAKPEKIERAFQQTMNYWEATLAYYLPGLHLDELQAQSVDNSNGDQALVLVPAQADGSTATIRVLLHRDSQAHWAPISVDFAPPKGGVATRPSKGSPASSQAAGAGSAG